MPASPPFPLHRINQLFTKLWFKNAKFRAILARNLLVRYRAGFGVCAADCSLVAVVNPAGGIRELDRPYRVFEMWQLANKPDLAPGSLECPCQGFFDPEVRGPYREKSNGRHHPFCQFEQRGKAVFVEARGRAASRIGMRFEMGVPIVEPKERAAPGPVKTPSAQERPDDWERIRDEKG